MIKVIQFMQLLAFHAFVDIDIPANLYYFLLQTKLSLLQFLPNWLAIPLPTDTYYFSSPLKIIDAFTDFAFLRNTGQIIFLFVLMIPFVIIFVLLRNPRCYTEWKIFRNLCEQISVNRFTWMVMHDIVSIMYLPILWFAFMQCK